MHVAVLSGRTVADLARFDFPDAVDLVGSHGMETAESELRPLDAVEHDRLDTLRRLAIDAAEGAGSGAWVEHKPASVVLHVRQVPDERADAALGTLRDAASAIEGTTAKEGSEVLELFTRSANKGDALDRLRSELGVASTVYVGDDVTDEDAFKVLGSSDVTVKVGHADTAAVNRLQDTDAVAQWLQRLAENLAAG